MRLGTAFMADIVREVFFAHHLRKHQWSLMVIPPLTVDPQQTESPKWSQKFTGGFYLPLGVFFDVHWKQELHYLSWAHAETEGSLDAILITADKGLPFNLIRTAETAAGFWRRFEQPYIEPSGGLVTVTPSTKIEGSRKLFLPIADLRKKLHIPGLRCIEIEPADLGSHQARQNPRLVGQFKGVTDFWAKPSALEEVHFTKYTLYANLR